MEDMVAEKPSVISKIASLFTRTEEVDEFDAPIADTTVIHSQPRQTIRYTVTVRRTMTTFEDAMAAANGLKHGEQQILNLSGLAIEVKEKALNFLCGVNYIQEGTWEQIADDVYLIAPKHALVEVTPATPRMNAITN
jgi:cell division inhibitor SepF